MTSQGVSRVSVYIRMETKPALLIRHFVTPSLLGKASDEETY